MSKAHPELLYILPLSELTTSMTARIYYTDGTNATITLGTGIEFRPGEVQVKPIGFDRVGYAAVQPSKTIERIKVWIGTEDENEQLYYYPYTPQSDQSVALYYVNSAGGRDSLICTGDVQHLQDHASINTVTPLIFDETMRNLRQYGLVGQRVVAGKNTAQMHRYATRDEVTALRDFDLFREGEIYEEVSGVLDFLPIVLTQPIVFPSEKNNLVAPQISFRYRFEQKAFDRVGL